MGSRRPQASDFFDLDTEAEELPPPPPPPPPPRVVTKDEVNNFITYTIDCHNMVAAFGNVSTGTSGSLRSPPSSTSPSSDAEVKDEKA